MQMSLIAIYIYNESSRVLLHRDEKFRAIPLNKSCESTLVFNDVERRFQAKVFLAKSCDDWSFLEKFPYLCRVIQNRNSTLVDI